jgi:hypothetical protein
MRSRGYPLVQVVEHWNPHVGIRQDLFGILDVLCVGPDVVGIQTTADSGMSARIAKIKAATIDVRRDDDQVETVEVLRALRRARVRVLVHGWRKRNGRWWVREVELSQSEGGP